MPIEDPKDPATLVVQANKAIEDFKASQANLHRELKESAEKSGSDASAALKASETLAAKIEGISASLVEIEQKMADKVTTGKAAVETLGQMVIKSDEFKAFAKGGNTRLSFQANTIIGQEGSPLENSRTIVAPDRLPGIVPGAFRLLKIRDVLPQGNTTSNAIEYTRELVFTNAAAETQEAAQKPESTLTFELQTSNVRTIATFIKASKQVLDDAPQLASYIDTRLRYAVDYRIDNQLVNGNGAVPNLSGMLQAGNFTAFTPLSSDNQLDSINKAIYQIYATDYAPNVIFMNPVDWGSIERLKKGTNDASYIIGNPLSPIGPVLWGLPVVVSNAVPAGKFIVANTEVAYQVWNREGTKVEIFEQDTDNVQKNLLTIRAESRLAFSVYRPASVRAGSLLL